MDEDAVRASDGHLSLTQVAKRAGIGMRTARTLVAGDWIPAEGLLPDHVVVARVAAALLTAPRPHGEGRGAAGPATQQRHREIIAQVYDLLGRSTTPAPAVLLVAPGGFEVGEQLMTSLSFFVGAGHGDAVLVLPVGQWIQQVRE